MYTGEYIARQTRRLEDFLYIWRNLAQYFIFLNGELSSLPLNMVHVYSASDLKQT